MGDDKQLQRFAQQFQQEISDRVAQDASEEGQSSSVNAFVDYAIELLEEVGAVEEGRNCYAHLTGPRKAAIELNGFAIDEDSERLDLITAIFHGEPMRAITKDDADKALTRARRALPFALSPEIERMEPASDEYGMMKAISAARGQLKEVRILLLTNGVYSTRPPTLEEIDGLPARAEIWDIGRFFRAQLSALPREAIEIDFREKFGAEIPCLPDRERGEYTAYLTLVPGAVLADLYHEYGPRLLELNVRSFLSVGGKVNKGIRKTLINEPDKFLAFNNGIVVTADEVDVVSMDEGGYGLRTIQGMQIVNGGQTTASIHRARYVDHAELDAVTVPAKIIVVPPDRLEEMVRTVSLYANSQNVVQIADFSANDPFHVEIERLSNEVWCPDGRGRWFYERARGQYQVEKNRAGRTTRGKRKFEEQTPATRRFTKTEMAKFLWAWDQRPYLVSFGAQKTFEMFMQDLRTKRRGGTWSPDEAYFKQLVAKAILFRAVTRITKQERFPAYQANIAVYTVSFLAWKTGSNLDFERIWQTQAVSAELYDLLRQMTHAIDEALRADARGRMVSESAKKESCWEAVRETEFELPSPLPLELRVQATQSIAGSVVRGQQAIDPVDLTNIEACRQVTGEEWLRIHAWGTRTRHLTSIQCGIAHTLAGYAAAGWLRSPSIKQARQGVRILQQARLVQESQLEIDP